MPTYNDLLTAFGDRDEWYSFLDNADVLIKILMDKYDISEKKATKWLTQSLTMKP